MKKNPGRFGCLRSPAHVHVWSLPRHRALRGLLELGVGMPFTLPERERWAAEREAADPMPIEGPYFFSAPEERRRTGSGLAIRGAVLDAVTREPIPGATIVRWHANASGVHEDEHRALMVADASGAYELETIVPGDHGGLPRHVHFYVFAPGYADLAAVVQWENKAPPDRENELDFALQRAAPPVR